MSEIKYIDVIGLQNEVKKLDQELLFIQIDTHFENSSFHTPFVSLFENNWEDLILYIEENLDFFGSVEKPNVSIHPKELAIVLEVIKSLVEIIRLFKDEGILKSDYESQKLFAENQIQKIVCEEYKKKNLITSEYAPFVKWDKVANKERISREYVNLNLLNTFNSECKYYLFSG